MSLVQLKSALEQLVSAPRDGRFVNDFLRPFAHALMKLPAGRQILMEARDFVASSTAEGTPYERSLETAKTFATARRHKQFRTNVSPKTIEKIKQIVKPPWHSADLEYARKVAQIAIPYATGAFHVMLTDWWDSSDQARLTKILKTLAVYRLAFGQPRQAELVEHLLEHEFSNDEMKRILDNLMIDLSPISYGC